ncbi:hypothetical protein AX17_007383 [Amanita inopinata Kibby_2008]|nr:hypothetical protein AX17_007383 [Amanita inopinata Kibby_2008]
MAPKVREQHARQAHSSNLQALTPEVIAKRTRRHLEELERSNYTEPTILPFDDDEDMGRNAKGRARQTISDKRNLNIRGNSPAAKKKKSTMNVRTALLYRKSLATWVEESVGQESCFRKYQANLSVHWLECGCPTPRGANIFDGRGAAVAVPATATMLGVWLLGPLQMPEMRDAVLQPQLRKRAQ